MIVRAASLAQARAAVAEGAAPGAGLTLAMARGADASPPTRVLDISGLPELDGIRDDGDRLRIGALVTVQQLSESPVVRRLVPTLSRMAGEIGSAPLRRLATLGGNIGWGAGDLVPVVLAQRGRLLLDDVEFPIGARPLRGLIEAVVLPTTPFAITFAEKVGLRSAFSPTLVTVAATADVVNGKLFDVCLAVGGGSEHPRRLASAEAALEGMARHALGGRLREALEREILGERADDDARLRARVAANLLADGLRETRS